MHKISHVFKEQGHLNKNSRNVTGSACLFLLIIALSLITACSSAWEPSDNEAVRLLENYYLFSRNGKEIDAEIIERKKFNKECKCFPVKFRIISKKHESFEKTFYFFKSKTGIVEVSEYQFGLMM